ncbi:hypothetical protein B0H14DRAFT_2574307 [Mycena olivaceomarginata]|nr:hypothetical protein B0H14DRAFT_2574307 [Mycena olivaceomarginata]
MPSPPTPIMQLTELTVGSLLYGTYLNLFLTSMYILVKRSRGAHTSPLHHSTMFVLGCTLFVTVTANWIILIIINFNGFIFFEGGTAAPEYFAIPRLGIQAALWGTAIVSIILNDCMMMRAIATGRRKSKIYRLWVVWERKKGIIADKGLIAWKIWRITRICQPLNGTNLNHFLAMVIESSALYTVWALFFVVSQQETSILQYFSFGVHPMIAGIANALLQARIGMGKTVEPATSALTSIHFATRSTDAGPSAGEASSGDVGMKPITL